MPILTSASQAWSACASVLTATNSTPEAGVDHPADGVGAAAADSDDLDHGQIGGSPSLVLLRACRQFGFGRPRLGQGVRVVNVLRASLNSQVRLRLQHGKSRCRSRCRVVSRVRENPCKSAVSCEPSQSRIAGSSISRAASGSQPRADRAAARPAALSRPTGPVRDADVEVGGRAVLGSASTATAAAHLSGGRSSRRRSAARSRREAPPPPRPARRPARARVDLVAERRGAAPRIAACGGRVRQSRPRPRRPEPSSAGQRLRDRQLVAGEQVAVRRRRRPRRRPTARSAPAAAR